MKYPKRSQYKYAKSPYRIRKWPEYEAGPRRRGDLTVWLSEYWRSNFFLALAVLAAFYIAKAIK